MVGPDDEGDNRNATIDQSKQLLAPLDASAGQTAAVDDLAPSVPVKRPAKQADLRGFFGGGAKAKVQTEHGLEAAEAPAAVSAQPHALEGATCDAGPVDEPLVPEPAEKPKRTRKRSYVTSQDADAEEEPVKSSKASRRKSNEPKPAKDDTAGEGEGEAPGKGKKAPMAGQRNILSFFGGPKGTGAAAVQVAEAEKVAEPASVTILESSLEEDIQKAESEHDESVLGAEPAEKPRRRSPRERRKPKVIESAEPEAPVPTKPTRKRSRRTQSTKELATKSVADSTDEKGVISIDSESEAGMSELKLRPFNY